MKHLRNALLAMSTMAIPVTANAQESVASAEKTIPGGTLMLVAYLLFVAMMLGYLALLSYRQRRLDHDIDGLEKRLDELAEATSSGVDGAASPAGSSET